MKFCPARCPFGACGGRADIEDAIGLAILEPVFPAAYGLDCMRVGIDAENGEFARGLIALCIVCLDNDALFCICVDAMGRIDEEDAICLADAENLAAFIPKFG